MRMLPLLLSMLLNFYMDSELIIFLDFNSVKWEREKKSGLHLAETCRNFQDFPRTLYRWYVITDNVVCNLENGATFSPIAFSISGK